MGLAGLGTVGADVRVLPPAAWSAAGDAIGGCFDGDPTGLRRPWTALARPISGHPDHEPVQLGTQFPGCRGGVLQVFPPELTVVRQVWLSPTCD